MRLASARLVSQLQRRTAESFYGDSGYLLIDVSTGAFDDYNNAIVTTTEVPISCSFTDTPSMENWKDLGDVQEINGEVRFATPRPEKGYKFKLTGRFDRHAYPDTTFEIIGIRNRDTFGYLCALKAVTL